MYSHEQIISCYWSVCAAGFIALTKHDHDVAHDCGVVLLLKKSMVKGYQWHRHYQPPAVRLENPHF